MPKKYKSCVKKVQQRLKAGKIKKTYRDEAGRRKKTSPYAICGAVQRAKFQKMKRKDKMGRTIYKGDRDGKFYIFRGKKVYQR